MKQWLPPSVKAKICLLPLHRDKYVSKQIKYDGNWEYEIQIPLFRNFFPNFPKAAFIDIGGQLGIYSLSAAKLGRKVFTFEPLRETLMYLTTSIAVNSLQNLIRVFPVALMDRRHQCLDVVVDKTNIGGSFVQLKENCTANSTPVATLDDLLPIFTKLGLEEALIKMDCEGSEPRVILGGLNFLKAIRVPVIAMEFAGSRNIVQKSSATSVEYNYVIQSLEALRELGYIPTRVGGDLEKNLTQTRIEEWPGDITWLKVK
ncbi:uncharacterized protein LOC142336860 isoform X2 [Convolutriloba macropyga]